MSNSLMRVFIRTVISRLFVSVSSFIQPAWWMVLDDGPHRVSELLQRYSRYTQILYETSPGRFETAQGIVAISQGWDRDWFGHSAKPHAGIEHKHVLVDSGHHEFPFCHSL